MLSAVDLLSACSSQEGGVISTELLCSMFSEPYHDNVHTDVGLAEYGEFCECLCVCVRLNLFEPVQSW